MTSRSPLLDKLILNPIQREAVTYHEGPQLVFAGAGSGKTRVLTAKIAWLIQDQGLDPSAIFAATFTNKAAREMRGRVESLIGIPCANLWIGTFHSLCARILRREAAHFGYTPAFSIYDADDQVSLMKKLMKLLELDERTMTPGSILNTISKFKNGCITPAEAASRADSYYDQQVVRVYRTYQESLRNQQAMDFDDLITNTVYLLRQDEQIRTYFQERFSYVLVDEYQDTNLAQFYFVQLLAQAHGKIFAVGDDDQSIYGWRGAQVENILTFEEVFPGTRTFKLEQNYRSTLPILNFANAAIAPNTRRAAKKLWTASEQGVPVQVTEYADDRQESEIIASNISKLISSSSVKPSEIFILYRTNAQSRSFEDALRKRSIPYVIVGGLSFYQRKEVKDCLAYLRLLANPGDDVSFDRIMNVPARGLGDKARENLLTFARATQRNLLEAVLVTDATNPLATSKGAIELRKIFTELRSAIAAKASPEKVFDTFLLSSQYLAMYETDDSDDAQARVDNINELANVLAEWSRENKGKELTDFLQEVALISDLDKMDQGNERVSLMTLHSAKGLEVPYVFVVGLEDGILPTRTSSEDTSHIEEERRLLYVGITRAMKVLRCSYVLQRWRFGAIVPMSPSRFLNDISTQIYEFVKYEEALPVINSPLSTPRKPGVTSGFTPTPPQARKQVFFDDFSQDTVQFRMGQAVSHKLYGVGKIVSISGFGEDMRLSVLFGDGQRRKLVAKFANLTSL